MIGDEVLTVKYQARIEDEFVIEREEGLELLFIDDEVASSYQILRGLVDTTGLIWTEASLQLGGCHDLRLLEAKVEKRRSIVGIGARHFRHIMISSMV